MLYLIFRKLEIERHQLVNDILIYKEEILNKCLYEYIKDLKLQEHFKENLNYLIKLQCENHTNLKNEIKQKLDFISTYKNKRIQYEISLIGENYSQKLFEKYISKNNMNQINFNNHMNIYMVKYKRYFFIHIQIKEIIIFFSSLLNSRSKYYTRDI